MGGWSAEVATVAAVVATLVSASCAWPQVARIRRSGDVRGVSAAAVALTISSELGWSIYLGDERLWAAIPEGVVNITASVVLFVTIARCGARWTTAASAATAWLAVLLAARWAGGPSAIAALLAVAYLVQLSPAVWTAFRCSDPYGISPTTWILRLAESLLWGSYGVLEADVPLQVFGVIGTAESTAILLRVAWVRRRRSSVAVGGGRQARLLEQPGGPPLVIVGVAGQSAGVDVQALDGLVEASPVGGHL